MKLPKLKAGTFFKDSMVRKSAVALALFLLLLVFIVLLLNKQSDDYASVPAVVIPIESAKTTTPATDLQALDSGRTSPVNRFKAPYDETDNTPRIAIIMTGLGLQEDNTEKSILELPNAVTLALSPYGTNNSFWIDQAVQNRHEVLIGIPMEPANYPDTDPGPLTLLKRDTWEENLANLNKIATPYDRPVGYINEFGNAYLSSDVHNRNFLDWIQLEDAVFVENLIDNLNPPLGELSKQIRADYIASDMQIDSLANTNAIVARLRKLERLAKEKGYAVGIAAPYPLTIEVIKQWAKDLDSRGVTLSPISAVVSKRKTL